MKIELDFDQKIITVVSEVNMKDLYDKMKELKLDPKEWKLQHNSIIWSTTHQVYPIINYDLSNVPTQPYYDDQFKVTCNIN